MIEISNNTPNNNGECYWKKLDKLLSKTHFDPENVIIYRGIVSTCATCVWHPSILRLFLFAPVNFEKKVSNYSKNAV